MLKKFKLATVLLLLLASLTACVRSVDTDIESEAPKEFLRGYLKTVDAQTSSTYDVTHELITENGESVYVRSLIYDLKSDDYADAILAVRGTAREIDDVKTITVDDITIEKKGLEVESYDILTYRNPNLGFSLDLPVIASVNPKANNGVEISGGPVKGLFKVERSKVESDNERNVVSPNVKIGADQMDAERIQDDENGFIYLLLRDEYLYEVGYTAELPQDLLVAEQVLQSLRFIPFSEIELDEDSNDEASEDSNPTDSDEPNPLEDIPTESSQDTPADSTGFEVKSYTEAELQKFSPLESRPLAFEMYYPKNWYYAQIKTGYAFSNDPVEEDGEWTSYVSVDGKLEVDIPRDWKKLEKGRFSVYGPESELDNMEVMLSTLGSIVEND